MVQSPFYPGDGACHVYVLHPPGGLVGGDDLALSIDVAPHAHALLTTPAASKLYRCDGRSARQRQRITVAAAGACEWLPQETLAFTGADARIETAVDLAAAARFLGWEHGCLGRPANGEAFTRGRLVQSLEVRVEGSPRLLERQRLEGGAPALAAPWGLDGRAAGATVVLYPASESLLALARRLVDGLDECRAGASVVDGLLVCRALAAHIRPLRGLLRRLWEGLRPALLGCRPVPPRIWAT